MGYMHPESVAGDRDRQSCVDVNECRVLGDTVCRNGRCENLAGVFR